MAAQESSDTNQASRDDDGFPSCDPSASWILAENTDAGLGQIFEEYGIDPDRELNEADDSRNLVLDLLRALEGPEAEVYRLRFVEQKTSDEILRTLNITFEQLRLLEQQGIDQMKAVAQNVLRRRHGIT